MNSFENCLDDDLSASAALAQPEGPTDEELWRLNAELFAAADADSTCGYHVVAFARIVLARWGHPAPQPVADGEVAEHARWLNFEAEQALKAGRYFPAEMLTRSADLLSRQHPQPVPVSERLPGRVEQALIKAECALSDIAEGEAEESEGDPLEWAEKRAADALARIRPVMRQHQIQTSEWPPLVAHALPVPAPEPRP